MSDKPCNDYKCGEPRTYCANCGFLWAQHRIVEDDEPPAPIAPQDDALVARLRCREVYGPDRWLCNEAADRIATLTAERACLDHAMQRCSCYTQLTMRGGPRDPAAIWFDRAKAAEDRAERAEATAAAYKVDAERYRREWHKCRRHLRAANKGAELLSKVCRLHAAEHALRYFRDAAIEAGKK
jgi:hypothetical protein